MKLVVLGGGGVRTPILFKGILNNYQQIGLTKVVLYDNDPVRLEAMSKVVNCLLKRFAHPEIEYTSVREGLFVGADFIFSAIRVGKDEARIVDEKVPLRYDVIGQETIGPGGFAMALRTIPVLIDYARQIEEEAPDAWFVNFTNPSGIVTQALLQATQIRALGICDAPCGITRGAANILRIKEDEIVSKYIGLNHLGWAVDLLYHGKSVMGELAQRFAEYVKEHFVYGLFGEDYVKKFGAIPNEYLYYYHFAKDVLENMKQAPETRGEMIRRFSDELFQRLQEVSDDQEIVAAYNRYIDQRGGSYFNRETGKQIQHGGFDLMNLEVKGGYEAFALGLIRSIAQDERILLPVNVPNKGLIPELQPEDTIEVSCFVTSSGPVPLHVTLPECWKGLILQIKEYERLTAQAAIEGSYDIALQALSVNPFVGSFTKAKQILDGYQTELAEFIVLR